MSFFITSNKNSFRGDSDIIPKFIDHDHGKLVWTDPILGQRFDPTVWSKTLTHCRQQAKIALCFFLAMMVCVVIVFLVGMLIVVIIVVRIL